MAPSRRLEPCLALPTENLPAGAAGAAAVAAAAAVGAAAAAVGAADAAAGAAWHAAGHRRWQVHWG